MALDLVYDIPAELAVDATLEEILQAVKAVEEWDEARAETLDFIYAFRLGEALARPWGEEETAALIRHLGQVTRTHRGEALDALSSKRYAARWKGFRDVLDGRLRARRTPIPEAVMARPHLQEVMALVAGKGEIGQKEAREALGLGQPNMSRILRLMVHWDLVVKTKAGRSMLLRPGFRAKEALAAYGMEAPEPAAETPQPPSPSTRPEPEPAYGEWISPDTHSGCQVFTTVH